MNLIAIDPGYSKRSQGCACALFVGSALFSVWFERRPSSPRLLSRGDGPLVDRIIVEEPQQDERTRGIPPEVIARLAWEGGTLGAMYAGLYGCKFFGRTPTAWKGGLQKPVHHGRLWDVLSDDERIVLGGAATLREIEAAKERGALARWKRPGVEYYRSGWTTHNLLDAAALGATELGRLLK